MNYSDYDGSVNSRIKFLQEINVLTSEQLYISVKNLRYKGYSVGQHAYSATVRFFASNRLVKEVHFEKVMANPERKIPMIKLHRAIFNTGLRESKLAVEGSALWSRCTLQSPVEVVGWNASDEPQRKW